jgi:putative FmdB family regulatory protein
MPLYEYECDDCSHRFELIQKFSDDLATTCPKCSGALRKLVSSPAIQFKGTGWYITDYARKSDGQTSPDASENTKEVDTKSTEGADSSKTKGSDTKSEKKSSTDSSSNTK